MTEGPPDTLRPPGGGWRRWGSWGVGRSCQRFIARPGALALSPLTLKMPPCLADLSVGGVCPLLTHTFSEPTTIFHSTSTPSQMQVSGCKQSGPSLPSFFCPPRPPLCKSYRLQNAACFFYSVALFLHP